MMSATNHNSKRDVVIKYLCDLGLEETKAKDLEIGIYNWSLEKAGEYNFKKNWIEKMFMNIYVSKSRSILTNIDRNSYVSNQRLLNRLNDNEFKPH